MKLLFDENLAASLAVGLAADFPGSLHLKQVGLQGADDSEIWSYAAANGFMIVTKDDDFRGLSVLHGPPPKLLMVTTGNCPTSAIEQVLRSNKDHIHAFHADTAASLMELG